MKAIYKKCIINTLKNYISYRINNHTDTEDLVNQVFFKIIKNGHTYDATNGNLDAWIIGITKNTIFDYLKKIKNL